MTTALAGDKPDEPIGFLVKFLKQKFPDQASSANVPAPAMAPSSSLAKLMATDVPEESDDEDDYEDANAPEYVPPVNISKKARKTGFSAESLDPAKMKEKMKDLVVIPKEQEVKDMLLATGAVDVYIKKGDADEMKVHTYKPGDAFGELAIMYNAPRAATCRSAGTCKLWSLDRTSFKVIVVAASMLKRELYQGFLEKVPILETCNPGEIQTLADSLAEETYQDGAEICRQGDAGDFFYIIKDGEAKCSVNGAEVATLSSGMYFGEIALMTSKPRQATVAASGTLKVLALDRATFTRVLGSMEDIMKRNMDKYKEYIGSEI
eukprot:GSChrysophyteH1.ASY1.ANO1.285.1 assembled CDS